MRRISLIIMAAALSACASAETPQQTQARMDRETTAARAAIEAKDAAYVAAFNAGRFDQTSGTYTEQGVQMPPNAPANLGRAAIRASDSTFMSFGTSVLTVNVVGLVVNGPVAISQGEWTFDFKPGKNAPKAMKAMKDHGKSLTHWHNVNGEWMMAHDIWNSNTRPAAP